MGPANQYSYADLLLLALSGVLPTDEAIAQIKAAIKKTYGKTWRSSGPTKLCGR